MAVSIPSLRVVSTILIDDGKVSTWDIKYMSFHDRVCYAIVITKKMQRLLQEVSQVGETVGDVYGSQ